MHDGLHTKLLTTMAVALAVAAMAPIASAKSSPQGYVRIPAWLARIHYPGTSSEPTVYMAGPIAIPARLVRTQYPGTSSEPTVLVNNVEGPEPVGGGFDWTSAMIGAGGGLGVAVAAAGGVLALRRRRTLAQV